ncbi:MAG TPA: HAMP domain-containing sensor histidine kinase [Phototrophicaceae bacterium]|nr:HAMP domain-containing sensor histidine kinase [Phototrophicaceae bacterium]
MGLLKNISLGVKLNLLLLLVLGVLLGATVLLLVSNTRSLTEEIGNERIAEEVNIMQSRLAEMEKELSVDVDFLSSSVPFLQAVGRRDAEDVNTFITTANSSLELDDIDVVDGDGKLLADISGEGSSTAETALLTQTLTGQRISDVLVEDREDITEISIASAAPIASVRGNILGAVQMSLKVDDDFLRGLIFEREGVYVGLIHNDQILARTNRTTQEVAAPNILHRDITVSIADIRAAQSGQTVMADELISSNNVPYGVAYLPLNAKSTTAPAVMMILVELDEIYAFQNRTLMNTITLFVVLTLLAIGMIYIALNRIVIAPINTLKTIARKMTGGQYGQRIPITVQDEVGQLAQTFNEMASAIQQRETSLQAAREQAERADQVKSAFLASMSHELRTPLNAVINFTQFVIDGDTGPVNEDQSELLNEVVSSARHLLSLINDVLDMSKIEAGSLKLFIEDNVNLNTILTSVAATGRGLLADKSVRVQLEADSNLPLIRADRQRIVQILLNIVSNACKFTDDGEITIMAFQAKDEIHIAVRDTGPGIAPEDQALVFEAFKQAQAGLQRGGGTGLGMPIARSLAEAHGGQLWLESAPGQGSTFHVTLPVKSEKLIPTLVS